MRNMPYTGLSRILDEKPECLKNNNFDLFKAFDNINTENIAEVTGRNNINNIFYVEADRGAYAFRCNSENISKKNLISSEK